MENGSGDGGTNRRWNEALTAEPDFSAALGRIEALARVEEAPAQFAFEDLSTRFESLCEEWSQAMERVWQRVAYHAWVETKHDGRIVARTVVTYGSDTRTVWTERLPAACVGAHCVSVDEKIRERDHWLRVITAAVRTMTTITAASTNPLLILPAISSALKLIDELNGLLAAHAVETAA